MRAEIFEEAEFIEEKFGELLGCLTLFAIMIFLFIHDR